MSDFEDLERLLRLKRYEKPPEGFYEQFHSEFRSRQRSEMLRQSAHGLFFERVSTWMWGFGNRRWLYAGGVAYAAVMIVVFLRPMSEMFADSPEKVEPSVILSEFPEKAEPSGNPPADSIPVHDEALPDGGGEAPGAIREL